MIPLLVLHGPNLNLLGERETAVYGDMSLDELNKKLVDLGPSYGFEVRTEQSNYEGGLIDALHEARNWAKGVIINPGGYSHTSGMPSQRLGSPSWKCTCRTYRRVRNFAIIRLFRPCVWVRSLASAGSRIVSDYWPWKAYWTERICREGRSISTHRGA
jgi:hypothetical protein